MEELVDVIVKQTGLPRAQAEQVAEVAVDFIKERLPSPIASQVDAVLSSGSTISAAEDLLEKGKGLFGKK